MGGTSGAGMTAEADHAVRNALQLIVAARGTHPGWEVIPIDLPDVEAIERMLRQALELG